MRLFNIFKKKPNKTSLRNQETVFFIMTDENGVSYANMSDTIQYIPVGKVVMRWGRDEWAARQVISALHQHFSQIQKMTKGVF